MTLNERISEWFEPRPVQLDMHDGCREPLSEKGAWKYRARYWQWLPVEWHTDEAANARLLEAKDFAIGA